MNLLSKALAFLRFILPWTKSTVKDLKVVLSTVEASLDMLEHSTQYPFEDTRKKLKEAEDTL